MTESNESSEQAAAHAVLAARTASKLKPGTWESVQALALLSIAESLLAGGSSNRTGN